MTEPRIIYCCGCEKKVGARLTDGEEVYPRRTDLYRIPFWKCDKCNNWVGCHHKTSIPTNPLGCIPTPEIKRARQKIHSILDPIHKAGHIKRKELYRLISEKIGLKGRYHTATIRNMREAEEAMEAIRSIKRELRLN